MNVLIIEDEDLAAKKLSKTLLSVEPGATIVNVLDSIEDSVEWLQNNKAPDLILLDIELTDGQSFEIFNKVEVSSTVIFTTSYDEHALRAFKLNSIDYLLKPVQREELEAALHKYKRLKGTTAPESHAVEMDRLIASLQQLQPKVYRKRFLVKHLQRLVSVKAEEIAYFYSDERLNFFKTFDDKRYVIDFSMDELQAMLDPDQFYRISRAYLISPECIDRIGDYFGHRLALNLKPQQEKEAIVSREKVSEFKKWLGK